MTKSEIYDYHDTVIKDYYVNQAQENGISSAYLYLAKYPVGLNWLSSLSREYFNIEQASSNVDPKQESKFKSFFDLSNFLIFIKSF